MLNDRENSLEPLNSVNVKGNSLDYIVAFAFIEHISTPLKFFKSTIPLLIPQGRMILTCPVKIAKPILEFLSYRLDLISPRGIREHKNYYNKRDLVQLLSPFRNIKTHHHYFELGLNNLLPLERMI